MFDQELLQKEINDLIVRSCTEISTDVKKLLEIAFTRERNKTAQSMISSMLENIELAKQRKKPICQSPGYPTIYVSFGDETVPGEIRKLYSEAIIEQTENGYLRPSMVHPLLRTNPGDNSGIGVPNFELEYKPSQDYLEMIISFKGCGAELGNAMQIFTTAKLGRNFSGLKKYVLETVVNAGGKPCPPYGIGIGIGGQMDVACKLSRKAISVRRWDDRNPNELYSDLEDELLHQINDLGIGAAGTGGDTVALAVKIESVSTHTAIAPVAINFHCWVARRAGIRLYLDGRKDLIF